MNARLEALGVSKTVYGYLYPEVEEVMARTFRDPKLVEIQRRGYTQRQDLLLRARLKAVPCSAEFPGILQPGSSFMCLSEPLLVMKPPSNSGWGSTSGRSPRARRCTSAGCSRAGRRAFTDPVTCVA